MARSELNTKLNSSISPYTITVKPSSRSLKISVGPDGEVVVTKPRLMPDFLVRKFVEGHQDWITKQQRKRQKQVQLMTNSEVYIFGKIYQRTIAKDQQLATGVTIQNDQAVYQPVSTLRQQTTSDMQKKADVALNAFLKRAAQNFIIPRTTQLAATMNITYTSLTLRNQKSRWGSCSSLGSLNFNWRLVHFSPEVIDYVIIHELAHRTHMNHSREFWRLVAKFDPLYTQHKKVLHQSASHID